MGIVCAFVCLFGDAQANFVVAFGTRTIKLSVLFCVLSTDLFSM